MSNKITHCDGCPIDIHTEKGEMADSYGCLPYYGQVKQWYLETGKVWACHENNKNPCVGFLKKLKRDGIQVSVNRKTELITEDYSLNDIYHDQRTSKADNQVST